MKELSPDPSTAENSRRRSECEEGGQEEKKLDKVVTESLRYYFFNTMTFSSCRRLYYMFLAQISSMMSLFITFFTIIDQQGKTDICIGSLCTRQFIGCLSESKNKLAVKLFRAKSGLVQLAWTWAKPRHHSVGDLKGFPCSNWRRKNPVFNEIWNTPTSYW